MFNLRIKILTTTLLSLALTFFVTPTMAKGKFIKGKSRKGMSIKKLKKSKKHLKVASGKVGGKKVSVYCKGKKGLGKKLVCYYKTKGSSKKTDIKDITLTETAKGKFKVGFGINGKRLGVTILGSGKGGTKYSCSHLGFTKCTKAGHFCHCTTTKKQCDNASDSTCWWKGGTGAEQCRCDAKLIKSYVGTGNDGDDDRIPK